MSRHAFLILAHNEYNVLKCLVQSLDCPEVDIYIHIDKKVDKIPSIKTKYSKLRFIKDREDVYWGTLNLVKAETALFKEAFNFPEHYGFYHLISGIHYPLRPIKEILSYFDSLGNTSVIQPIEDSEDAINKRLGRYHFFLKYYCSPNIRLSQSYRLIWRISLKLQQIVGIRRNTAFYAGKSSNWCSLTHDAVGWWLEDQTKIMKRFRWTYCSDEYVTMSILKEHNLPFVERLNMLYQKFVNGNPIVFLAEDYKELINSGALFGRKFTEKSLQLIKQLSHAK